MDDKRVKISIIMPVYNSGKYLETCINSILQQHFDSFELLLIDDGSTDNSSQICDLFGEKDSRVKVYHKENGGICEARNYGLEHAKGEYIAFSDHDDIVNQGFLKNNYEYAKQIDADVIKFGREALIFDDENLIKKDVRKFKKNSLDSIGLKDQYLRLRLDGAMTCVWDGFFRKDFLSQNHITFNTDYKKGGEDIDFCSKCFSKASRIAFNDGVYYVHYIRIGYSTSTRTDDQRLLKFKMLTDNLEDCVHELGIEKQDNALFFLNIIKELVYPSLIYFKNLNKRSDDVKMYLQKECEKFKKYAPSILELIKVDRKWGAYAAMFKMGMYGPMYEFLKYKK